MLLTSSYLPLIKQSPVILYHRTAVTITNTQALYGVKEVQTVSLRSLKRSRLEIPNPDSYLEERQMGFTPKLPNVE
jgi:hypothetical protein